MILMAAACVTACAFHMTQACEIAALSKERDQLLTLMMTQQQALTAGGGGSASFAMHTDILSQVRSQQCG